MEDIVEKGNNEIERYMSIYSQVRTKYKDEKKLAVFYQIGDFYEIYSLINSEDGSKEGNGWELAGDLNLVMGKKNAKVYNNPKIIPYIIGIPLVSLDKYLTMAVNDYGWTIVLYVQSDTPTGRKKRVFDSIISPGTNTNTTSETNNMMVLYMEKVKSLRHKGSEVFFVGVAFLDTLTGEVGTIQYPFKEQLNEAVIYDEIIKLITIKNPKDILIYTKKCNMSEKQIVDTLHLNYYNHKIYLDCLPLDFTKLEYQTNLFENIYKTSSIEDESSKLHIFETLNIKNYPYTIISLTILMEYIIKRNQSLIYRINKPYLMFNSSSNLILQNNSLEQLNIVNNQKRNFHFEKRLSLLTLLDKTKSIIGKREFRNKLMNPITDIKILNERYNNIDIFNTIDFEKQGDIRDILGGIIDIKRATRHIINKTMRYNDICPLFESIKACMSLYDNLKVVYKYDSKANSLLPKLENNTKLIKLKDYFETTFNMDYLRGVVFKNNDINETIFNESVSEELNNIQLDINTNKTIIDEIIRRLTIIIDIDFYTKKKDKDGTKHLINKGENVKYNTYITTSPARVKLIEEKLNKKDKEGKEYCIKIGSYKLKKRDFNFDVMGKGKVRIDLACIRNSGAHLNNKIDELRAKTNEIFMEKLEYIYEEFSSILLHYSDFIGELDFIQSCCLVANENGYVRPTIDGLGKNVDNGSEDNDNNSYIDVKDIRHPLIEQIQQDVPYVANDICLGKEGENGILLFGVNAVGKSSLMKSIGCCIIMAQSGMFVPASSFVYRPFKYLFTRICSNDNIFAGLSTFEVEMQEFKTIMNYADNKSIILGDEICSGTETLDATAIVASGINILAKRKANFLFATHLHYLSKSDYITSLNNVNCKHMSVIFDSKNKCLVYERKLQSGSGPSSYGIEVCKSMDMDEDFMEMAQNIRDSLDDKVHLITGKKSKYNMDKIISSCEVCCHKLAVDTHHIKFQCTADNDTGMIEHWHKDSKFNLVGLCKDCHQSVHSSPPRLQIDGYITTSNGIKLDFKRLGDNVNDETNNVKDKDENNKNKKEEFTEEKILSMIKNYNSRNLSVRQIQRRLKEDKIKKTLKELKEHLF